MTLDAAPGLPGVRGSRTELESLLGYVASDDRDALIEFFDLTYPMVARWLQAGIPAGPRQDALVTAVYEQVWARASDFEPGDIGPLHWLASIVRATMRPAPQTRVVFEGPD